MVAVAAAAIPAAVSIGTTIAGGSSQQGAASDAAQTQMNMYNQTRQDLLPYNQGGQTAFSNLSSLLGTGGQANSGAMLGALRNYPGYQFAQQEGVNALDRSAASKGLLLSGGQMKDVTNYGQGMADQLFNTYFNQNHQLASLGENAAAQTGNAGTNAANGTANAQIAGGQAGANMWGGLGQALNGQGGLFDSLGGAGGLASLFGGSGGSGGGLLDGFGSGYAGSGLYSGGMFIG